MAASVGAPPQWGTNGSACDQSSSGYSQIGSTSVSPGERTGTCINATSGVGQDGSSHGAEKQRFYWENARNASMRVDQYRGILTFNEK
jgi:hypothetical protein